MQFFDILHQVGILNGADNVIAPIPLDYGGQRIGNNASAFSAPPTQLSFNIHLAILLLIFEDVNSNR